jgi:hypothetical protein
MSQVVPQATWALPLESASCYPLRRTWESHFGKFWSKRKATTEEDAVGCGGSNTTYLPSRAISGLGANAY